MSTKFFGAVTVLVVFAGVFALAAGTPETLSPTGFVGRSGEITIVVDTSPGLRRGDQKYLPLLVWVGHRDARTLKATRGSFTLVDPQGGRQPLAEYDTVRRGATLTQDYSLVRFQQSRYDYADMEFLFGRRIPRVAFFPDPAGSDVLYDTVEMPSFTWFRSLLYFANPAGRDRGVYTLQYEDPSGAARVEVPFTVNWAK